MAFRHFNNQKSTSGNHQLKGGANRVQSAWQATLDVPLPGMHSNEFVPAMRVRLTRFFVIVRDREVIMLNPAYGSIHQGVLPTNYLPPQFDDISNDFLNALRGRTLGSAFESPFPKHGPRDDFGGRGIPRLQAGQPVEDHIRVQPQ